MPKYKHYLLHKSRKMSKRTYWGYRGVKESLQTDFEEYLGEKQEEKQISEEEEEYYNEIKETVNKIFDKKKEKTEKEYRELLFNELITKGEVREVEERLEKNNYVKKRYELDAEVILELRKQHLKEDINDLAKYMQKEDKVIGILIAIRKKNYKMYMLLKEDMVEEYEYILYTGEEEYKYKVKEKRCVEIKKEEEERRKEEIKQSMPKEKIEQYIKEGKTYEEISEIYGEEIKIIKECCKMYELKSNAAKSLEERKICPEDYKEILENPVKYAMKQMECKRKLKEAYKLKRICGTEKGIYGVFDKITNKCIYIGSTDNCILRLQHHKEDYERGNSQWLHTYMRENGGWDNYIYILLEERKSHIGLNVIERIWWEAAKPVGNKVDPLRK